MRRIIGVLLIAAVAVACGTQTDDNTDTSPPQAPAETTTTVAEDPQVTAARRSAEGYLDMTGFSRTGLIGQLEFEGYSTDAATAAVDSLGADWRAEAVQSAESYVELSAFSHSGLVDQLEFEGYTSEEAEHAASTVLGF